MPPVEATRLCPPIPDVRGDGLDDLAEWAGVMIDQYTDCRLRHKALGDWARGK